MNQVSEKKDVLDGFNYDKTFSNCFPKDNVNREDIDKNVKDAFKKVFNERFANKTEGDFDSPETVLSKRNWAIALGCIVALITLVAFVALHLYAFALVGTALGLTYFWGSWASFGLGMLINTPIISYACYMDVINNYANKKFCELKANDAIDDFLKNGLTIGKFQEKYADLFERQLLEQRDLTILQTRDYHVLSEAEFLKKDINNWKCLPPKKREQILKKL